MSIAPMEASATAACDAVCQTTINALQAQATIWRGQADSLFLWFCVLSTISVACSAIATLDPRPRGMNIARVLMVVATISTGVLSFWRPDSQSAQYRAAYSQLQIALIEHGPRDLTQVRSAYRSAMQTLLQQSS